MLLPLLLLTILLMLMSLASAMVAVLLVPSFIVRLILRRVISPTVTYLVTSASKAGEELANSFASSVELSGIMVFCSLQAFCLAIRRAIEWLMFIFMLVKDHLAAVRSEVLAFLGGPANAFKKERKLCRVAPDSIYREHCIM